MMGAACICRVRVDLPCTSAPCLGRNDVGITVEVGGGGDGAAAVVVVIVLHAPCPDRLLRIIQHACVDIAIEFNRRGGRDACAT